ncbi:hypothetical protein [Actinoplanes sp. GCM10030250]|uniref:hypothetical protein n=1 Tax=Actinoplanes sp. GCM10030250 TaxID=3273376 RepID=UPI0036097FC0
MRTAYRIIAMLIPIFVLVQLTVIAGAWFLVLNDLDSGSVLDKNTVDNWAHVVHSQVGMIVIPLLGLSLLIVSFFARVPGGIKWAAITLGVIFLQVFLAFAGFAAPLVGLLHGLNAAAVAAVAEVAARKAKVTTTAPAQPAVVA